MVVQQIASPYWLKIYLSYTFSSMQLTKEVSEVTMQRDLAQSQVKDLLQMVGDDKSSTVSVCFILIEEFTSTTYAFKFDL